MIYTEDDLEDGRTYDDGDLQWVKVGHMLEAVLQLDEGDRGPLDVEGPCVAVYQIGLVEGSEMTVLVTEL